MNLLFRWGLVLGAAALLLWLPGAARGDAEGMWVKVRGTGSQGPGGAEIQVEIMSANAAPAAMVKEVYAANAAPVPSRRKYSQLRRTGEGVFVGRVTAGTGVPGRVDLYIRLDDDSVQHGVIPVGIASPVMLELGTNLPALQQPPAIWSPWLWAAGAALGGAAVFRLLMRRRRPSA